MGVSGSGKSTVAGVLAGQLGWQLVEGDDLHPPANIAKMRAGHRLTDGDRAPWLAKIAAWISERRRAGRPAIVTCSALKRKYRDVLRADGVVFVHLAGTREQIARRLATRPGHFMPAALLDSQFADLEPPAPDENAITVDIGASAAAQAQEIVTMLGLRPSELPQPAGAEASSQETNPV
jgi:gluconokinase